MVAVDVVSSVAGVAAVPVGDTVAGVTRSGEVVVAELAAVGVGRHY